MHDLFFKHGDCSLFNSQQEHLNFSYNCTANEGSVRIQYKCQVIMYVFPEIKLLFRKQNCNVLSPSFYTHISVRLYISRIGLHILLQGNMWTDPRNIKITHRHMNVDIGAEAAQFPEKYT
jgi:hypothetical protein